MDIILLLYSRIKGKASSLISFIFLSVAYNCITGETFNPVLLYIKNNILYYMLCINLLLTKIKDNS